MGEQLRNSNRVLMLGCGGLGQLSGAVLAGQGFSVSGLRRNPAAVAAPLRGLAGDYTQPGGLGRLSDAAPDYLLFFPLPAGRSVEGYQRGFAGGMSELLSALGDHRPALTIMVSSTRVYRGGDGDWVDENSPLALEDERATAIVEAEERLLDCGLPAAVVRCGGIYGDPGGRLLSRIAGGEICAAEPTVYGNRIHREDAAGFLCHLVQEAASGRGHTGCFTAVDSNPAPRHEVESWLAERMGVEVREMPPPETPPEHKRCRNNSMLATGYELRYPDYRAGYGAVLSVSD